MPRKRRRNSSEVPQGVRSDAARSATTPYPAAPTRRTIGWALVAPLLAIVVFGQVAGFELLQYDDRTNVTENPYLNPVTFSGVMQFWREPYAGLYVPLTYTFFSAEAVVARQPATESEPARLDPRVFHIGNLLLHVGCVLLVFGLLRQLIASEAAACAGACLFALHPLQVESVAWVTETKGLLAAFWSLAALGLYDCFAQASPANGAAAANVAGGSGKRKTGAEPSTARTVSRVAIWYYVAATGAFALALLSKPSAVSVPAMALVLDVGLVRRTWRAALLAIAPWLALAGILVLVTRYAQPAQELAIDRVQLWQRPVVAADAIAFYLRKLVWPWPLGPDYGRTPPVVLGSLVGKLAWLLLVALVVAIYRLPRRRLLWTALALFAAALAPVSGLLPFGFQGMSTVADRYAYVAMLAPALLLAAILARGAPRLAWGAVALAIAGLAVLSGWQASLWRDDGTLFTHNIERIDADSHVSHNNLGVSLERQARRAKSPPEQQALLQSAAKHYDRARRLRPEMDEAWQHLAYVQGLLGQTAEAEDTFRQFVAQRPESPTGHYNLGTLLVKQNRRAEAVDEFRTALKLRPEYANAWLSLGVQLAHLGDPTGAIDALQRALAAGQNSRALQLAGQLNLARIHLAQGDRAAALEAAQAAARLAPNSPEAVELLRRLNAQ
ncbi:MAG: tetratricopeptide repeat protein [Pirellulales bacterium]